MMEIPNIKVNSSLKIQKKVSKEDTALNYGSGKLENLLATPSLVALMIEASVKLIDDNLPDGIITVGKMAQVIHEKPTFLGETVTLKVEIKSYDKSKILLEMVAYDEIGIIGTGIHERIIVNKDSLIKRANKRASDLENKNY